MNSIVNLKDGFITFNSNIDYSLSFTKCAIGYSNYNINSHERGSLVFLTNNNANTTNISMNSDIRMCIASDGNVGIGTNNPFSTPQRTMNLDVNGNVYAGNNSYFLSGYDKTGESQFFGKEYQSTILGGMEIENTTLDGNWSQKLHFHTHHFGTSNGRRMTILENGNVGIGITNPGYKLDVSGNINCSGLFVNGSAFTVTPSWTSVTNKPFTILDTTAYSPTATQTECEIIMYPRAAGANTLLSGRVWVDKPLKFTAASTSGGLITTYLPPSISLDINTTTLEIDANGKLNVKSGSGSSQWTTNGTNIHYNTGNIGIGTVPTSKLHIINSSTAANADAGNISLYVYNPTNAVNQKSIICNRVAGTASDKVIYAWDVHNSHGWSILTSGNNTALRINASWEGTGSDRLILEHNGNTIINSSLTVGGGITANSIQGLGTGPLVIDPNFSSENYILMYDEVRIAGTFRVTNNGAIKFIINSNTFHEFFGTHTSITRSFIYHGNGAAYLSTANTYFSDLVVKFNGSTWTTSWIGASSSAKIKKDIQDLDDNECLNKLLALRPVKYRYIDITKNFDPEKKVYGFIAEEVKQVLPEAVNDKEKELIPNIYMMGSVENDILTIEKELEIDIEYTCYTETETIKIKVIEDLSNNNYKIDKTYEIKTDLFIYGKIDNNFHILKKEYFHALTVSAVQELHKKINNLENRLLALEAIIMKTF